VLCRLHDPRLAVARLEWGRARSLAEALAASRPDLTGIEVVRPDLARRYQAAADQLAIVERTGVSR